MNMQINIKAKDLELTGDLKEFINQKVKHIEKFLHLSGDQQATAEVEIGKEFGKHHKHGNTIYGEINLSVWGKLFRARELAEDKKVAIEQVVEEIVRQVRRDKEKKLDLFRRGAGQIKKLLKFGK